MSRLDADALTASLTALIGAAAIANDRFGVAVSGGADSLALLMLAHAAFGSRLAAASVDHRLRPEAAEECAYVAELCAARGISHVILTAKSPPDPPSQAGARALRYQLLDTWLNTSGIDWLLTAHHADDQLETLLMRLARGSGIGGMAGIRSRNGRVLRPLLGWPQSALRAVVDAAGIAPVNDPSNTDRRFDRVRMRQALNGQMLVDPAALAASMDHLAQADEALEWATQRLLDERTTPMAQGIVVDSAHVPAELRQRLIHHSIEMVGKKSVRGSDVSRLIATLAPGEAATLGAARVERDRASPDLWRICTAPPRRR